jgi:hypothetical protein
MWTTENFAEEEKVAGAGKQGVYLESFHLQFTEAIFFTNISQLGGDCWAKSTYRVSHELWDTLYVKYTFTSHHAQNSFCAGQHTIRENFCLLQLAT